MDALNGEWRVAGPPEMADRKYYQPTNRGLETKIGEKLDYLAKLDANSQHLPISEYPQISPTVITVSTMYPGANADVV